MRRRTEEVKRGEKRNKERKCTTRENRDVKKRKARKRKGGKNR